MNHTKTNVTDLVQRYRLALRHIWNCCIWVDPNLRNWDSVYSFRDIKLPLFRTLVGDPLEIEADQIFGAEFHAEAKHATGLAILLVNAHAPNEPYGGVWSPLQGWFKPDNVTLTVVDLFDWDHMRYLDLQYYVVLIEGFQTHPQHVGHHALVEVRDVDVFWSSSTANGGACSPQKPDDILP